MARRDGIFQFSKANEIINGNKFCKIEIENRSRKIEKDKLQDDEVEKFAS